jgi:hypothetical protein
MDQNIETRSSTAQKFIYDEISKALARTGLEYDHPVRELLDREAEIVGVREPVVRVPGASGEMSMLDDRIKELKRDPSYATIFPADPPKVAKGDLEKLSEHFSEIADGSIRVE